MALETLVAPAVEPVTLAAARAFLRIGTDGDDSVLTSLLIASREALEARTGRALITATMRRLGAIFGGELSGHFYFADNYVCDSGEIAFVSALSLVAASQQPLSAMVADLRRYHATGEINFHVEDKPAAIAALKQRYRDGRQDELDGITVEYGDLAAREWWWFNVRASNTEPVLRLNLEAKTQALCQQKRAELVALIGTPEA